MIVNQWETIHGHVVKLRIIMREVSEVLTRRDASSHERSAALVRGKHALCGTLTEYRSLGLFEQIADSAGAANPEHRHRVFGDLTEVLEMERQVLQIAGYDASDIEDSLGDLRECMTAAGPETVLSKAEWLHRLDGAAARICTQFPSEPLILMLDQNFGRYVARVFAAHKVIKIAAVGAANIAAFTSMPDPITVKSTSTYLAFVAMAALTTDK